MLHLVYTACFVALGCMPVTISEERCLVRHHVIHEIVDNDPSGTDPKYAMRFRNPVIVARWLGDCQSLNPSH